MLNGFGTNTVKKIIIFVTLIFFVSIISIIFYLNFNESGYLHNGYFETYSPTDIKFVLNSFVFTFILLVLFKYVNFYKKTIIILSITLNIIIFGIRIALIHSFNVIPAGDMIQVFISIFNFLINNDLYHFMEGGYITTYAHQLTYSIIMMPFVSLFKEYFNGYYFINAFILQISIFLLSISFSNKCFLRFFWINLALNLFIPNIFFQFIFYSDPFGFFFISLTLYFLNKSQLSNDTWLYFALLFASISLVTRSSSIVISIAILIIIIFYSHFKVMNKIFFSFILVLSMMFSQTIVEKTFNLFAKTEVGEYSLPMSTWIALGLQGGFNDKYINYFSYNGHSEENTNVIVWEDINNSLDSLKNLNNLNTYIFQSLRYSWTNPDFDSLSFIMPQKWGASLSDFYNDNSIRLGRASANSGPTNEFGNFIYDYLFSFRNYEKIFLFSVLELSLLSLFFLRKQLFEWKVQFLMLALIGYSLIFLIVEKQPRFLFSSINLLIVFAFYILPEKLYNSNRIDLD